MSRIEVDTPEGAAVVLRACNPACARLDLLSVARAHRGQGKARAALAAVAAVADARAMTVHLSVDTGFGSHRAGLIRLYRGAGFRYVAGSSGAMIRSPRTA
ncbi:GNAT family N-acetyltransferase [Cellulosimicrobium sp. Marseille-Q4280]|uniref:GNAT family N-acetyltransferase n=1 Tax=Cellulosimicrobium sp. Marseille-Q4280 TaxID=2937992 RepID=UPI002040FB3B|nr:GNAT family N-acetyltransferase [Cellulosimicrobium sp. Marseille-Q4280]